MNKFTILLLSGIFLSLFTYGQNGWFDKSPTNASGLNDLYFIDANNGFAVGDSGKVYKTTNGGDSWTMQTSGVTVNLNAVHFVSLQKGFAVGNSGKIISTTNGGTNWTTYTNSTAIDFKDIDFNNPDSGVVVGTYSGGGYFLITLNGGTNWLQDGPVPSTDLRGVALMDDTTAITIGQMGSAAVIGKITLNTTYSVKGNLGGNQFNDVCYPSDDRGYVCGNSGVMFYSVNGGNVWNYKVTGLSTNLLSIFFIDDPYSDSVGYAGANGYIYKTTNHGSSWVTQHTTPGINYEDIQFVNNSTGYALSNTTIIKTTSGGVNLSVNVPDTNLVCSDSVQLTATPAYGGAGTLSYQWAPASLLSNPTSQNPYAKNETTTTFYVTVTDGNISAIDSAVVTVLPLPLDAGSDTSINCHDQCFKLNAMVNHPLTGVAYSWDTNRRSE
jgi:photosystem II stability/assembly factor-like uncharacterized protein